MNPYSSIVFPATDEYGFIAGVVRAEDLLYHVRYGEWDRATKSAYSLSVILFFVTGRYRVPILPFLAIGAAGGQILALGYGRAGDSGHFDCERIARYRAVR